MTLNAVAFYHISGVKQDLKAMLLERLPPLLAVADEQANAKIEALIEAGVPVAPSLRNLESHQTIQIHTTDKADLETYPAIEMYLVRSVPQGTGFAQEYRHELALGFTETDDDEERLQARLERLIWATRQAVRDEYLDSVDGAAPIDTGTEEYSPLLQAPERLETRFVRSCYLTCLITTVQ